MSILNALRVKLGLSTTPEQNFTLTAEAADGTLKLARGNPGATTQDILTVDASGNVIVGQKLLQSTPQSMIRLNTANGYGSTNTKIRRFLNVVTNQGTDITYADSATLGASFTINTNGVYAISYSDNASAPSNMGVSLNSTQLTTDIAAIALADQLCITTTSAANYRSCVGATLYLPAGAIIRAHTEGTAGSSLCMFIITRVA